MHKRDVDSAEKEGLMVKMLHGGYRPTSRKAWSQVQQKMFDLDKLDLTKATRDCLECNGTGVIRNTKIGGILTTIVCTCLWEELDG